MKNKKSTNFEDLIVWQKAHEFVLLVYSFSSSFPKTETFGLTSQLRRASISIPANIAEGFRKRSNKEKVHYYNISQGSIEECRYYLILSKDLKYGDDPMLMRLLDEISRLLSAYMSSILNSHYSLLNS